MINIYLSSSRAQGRNEVESQRVGSGSHCWQQCSTYGIRDQAIGFRDQNSHRLSLGLEINILGKKMGSVTKKYTSLQP